MKFKILLTWSKIMSLVVLCSSVFLDMKTNQTNTFMFALPFVTFLITGKQFFDKNKPEK